MERKQVLFEDRKEKRRITEFMDSFLLPMEPFLTPENAEMLRKALTILRNTPIEEDKEE